ncbi:MAG: DUF4912 domain-containing protein [Candidatus Omnitrophota bacterium]
MNNNKPQGKKDKLWFQLKKGFQKLGGYKISLPRAKKQTTARQEASRESLYTEKIAVEGTKFHAGGAAAVQTRRTITELPAGYDKDRIVLQTRDPWWLHTYWEVSESTWTRLRHELREQFLTAKKALRVYDVTNINFDGTNANRYFDIDINVEANNWYIDTSGPGRSWIVDFGLKIDNRFITIVRSNCAFTPLDGPSWITDEEWMIPDDLFARLYGLAVGFGSSPVKKPLAERLRSQFASGGLFSISSPVRKGQEKGFWLVVNTELIVYGATEPDAKVTAQGRSIKLRSDGTFSLRFALPDGKQVIPVKAVSSDNEDERTITPIVTKETK